MIMNSKNAVVTGIIKTDKGNVSFYGEDFKFTFMNADTKEEIVIDADENGYIWGKTYEGKAIAIYAKQSIIIKGTRVLNTWNYIISRFAGISKESIISFKGIRFKNGVIRTIHPCNALHEDYEKSKDGILAYRVANDRKSYLINAGNETISWIFGSEINQRMSIEEGNSLSNGNALLDILFDNQQGYKTFYDWYGYVCDFCSFLTFRNNIFFEKIFLLRETPYNVNEAFAECYVKSEGEVSLRKFVNIIPITYIDDNMFNEMIMNILKQDKNHKGLPIFITPKDDRDAKIMDVGKIRNICSALEMELDLGGVRLKSGSNMKVLIETVKKDVKEHRDGKEPLSSKAYDYIFGNISYWDQPLAERAYNAWKQHEDKMQPLLSLYGIDIDQEKIEAFVKARNNITHNGFTGIDEDVANTAFVLMGLVYCCTLTRIKMPMELIKDVMGRRLF
ncbi:hypothetical protein [Blautia wexlerae]|jgi:hypothetical protein|uniref:hypothetical protein n=2 Tax=Blautia wexlerae TaxID=418240 RepID=UPI000E4C98F2|nr:hypothetical protein [Blautia wexlerae]RHQ36794.1 hypothetical protein DWY50_09755 [Ruminococcus sp. AF25-28AC]MCB5688667.1 hypothetical protein [Blautia wexlerae]NSD00723.1 hypothetical protein [Blautia wexlerae]NSE92126.1 hypothetical protein [Blautia wexlerae]NSF13632.1 hypothetical protein [Blautia wexlerae]